MAYSVAGVWTNPLFCCNCNALLLASINGGEIVRVGFGHSCSWLGCIIVARMILEASTCRILYSCDFITLQAGVFSLRAVVGII